MGRLPFWQEVLRVEMWMVMGPVPGLIYPMALLWTMMEMFMSLIHLTTKSAKSPLMGQSAHWQVVPVVIKMALEPMLNLGVPWDVATDGEGNVYVADGVRIRKITSDGQVSTDALGGTQVILTEQLPMPGSVNS